MTVKNVTTKTCEIPNIHKADQTMCKKTGLINNTKMN